MSINDDRENNYNTDGIYPDLAVANVASILEWITLRWKSGKKISE